MRNLFVFLFLATIFVSFNLWLSSVLFVYFHHGLAHLELNPIAMVNKLFSKRYYGLEFWWENYSRITLDWWNHYMVKLLGSILGTFGATGMAVYVLRDDIAERFF